MNDRITYFLLILVIILICIYLLYTVLKSPFSYPYFVHKFDVTGKRGPQIEDFLDDFLIANGFASIQSHQETIDKWKQDCQYRISRSIIKGYRKKQYVRALDDSHAFKFCFIRQQTRYKQVNYVKYAYKASVQNGCFAYSYEWIKKRNEQLSDIGFECTLRAYHSKNQRKLATRKLREEIMKRDNFTCQICGKYMPDEIGLQIDHIIPIAKGGKTVPSNLRVLCSKCNASKSDKTAE